MDHPPGPPVLSALDSAAATGRLLEAHRLDVEPRSAPDLTEASAELRVGEAGQARRVLDLSLFDPGLLSILCDLRHGQPASEVDSLRAVAFLTQSQYTVPTDGRARRLVEVEVAVLIDSHACKVKAVVELQALPLGLLHGEGEPGDIAGDVAPGRLGITHRLSVRGALLPGPGGPVGLGDQSDGLIPRWDNQTSAVPDLSNLLIALLVGLDEDTHLEHLADQVLVVTLDLVERCHGRLPFCAGALFTEDPERSGPDGVGSWLSSPVLYPI